MKYIDKTEEYKALLKSRLDEYRYIHSLNVANSAKKLAAHYSADEDKAYIAGLLHDITKCENRENQLQMLENGGIILSRSVMSNPKLWHAMTAPVFISNYLHINDSEILSSVRYHTTGKTDMSLLDLIVYVADYISEERNYPDVDVMRTLAFESLEKAALYSLKFTFKKLSADELVICEDSLAFYNDLIVKGVTLKSDL